MRFGFRLPLFDGDKVLSVVAEDKGVGDLDDFPKIFNVLLAERL